MIGMNERQKNSLRFLIIGFILIASVIVGYFMGDAARASDCFKQVKVYEEYFEQQQRTSEFAVNMTEGFNWTTTTT